VASRTAPTERHHGTRTIAGVLTDGPGSSIRDFIPYRFQFALTVSNALHRVIFLMCQALQDTEYEVPTPKTGTVRESTTLVVTLNLYTILY
jgi:hypothetical protein